MNDEKLLINGLGFFSSLLGTTLGFLSFDIFVKNDFTKII